MGGWKVIANAFCPTGEGGGQDNSCTSASGGGSEGGGVLRLPKWVSPLHRAWLGFNDREVLYSDLARAAKMSIKELEEYNREVGGGNSGGWFVNSVTKTRAMAGDQLWAYLGSLRSQFTKKPKGRK